MPSIVRAFLLWIPMKDKRAFKDVADFFSVDVDISEYVFASSSVFCRRKRRQMWKPETSAPSTSTPECYNPPPGTEALCYEAHGKRKRRQPAPGSLLGPAGTPLKGKMAFKDNMLDLIYYGWTHSSFCNMLDLQYFNTQFHALGYELWDPQLVFPFVVVVLFFSLFRCYFQFVLFFVSLFRAVLLLFSVRSFLQ